MVGFFISIIIKPREEITLTDGTTTISRTLNITTTSIPTTNLYILANDSEGSVAGRADGNRLYYLTFDNSNTNARVRVYTPAMRKSDGVVGLFEEINQTFFAPPSGTFSYGKKIWEANNIFVKVNGTWKQGKPFIKVNGTWQEGSPYIKVNGNWEAGV